MSLTFNTLKVKARGSQARGEAKTKTASLVEALYGFDSGRSKKAILENRKKAEELKSDKGFVFEVSFIIIIYFSFNLINYQVLSDPEGKRKGIYKHPIIQKAVNAIWFQNKRDEGIIYPEHFKPISVPSIALILTAVSKFPRIIHIVTNNLCNRLNVISTNGFRAPKRK